MGRHPRNRHRGAQAPRYNDRRWRRVRARILRERPDCECGCGRPSEVVHHLDGRGLEGPRAYDPANLQALTKPCHDSLTGSTQGAFASAPRRRPPERHPGLIA